MMSVRLRVGTILGLVAAGAPLLLCLLCTGLLHGQVVGGSISGTITDNTGAVVAKATVSMKDLATGVVTAVKTNTQGLYSVPNLLPGTYQQTVTAAGFETAVRNGVVLTVGAQMVSNIAMKV